MKTQFPVPAVLLVTLLVCGCSRETVVGEWKGKPTTPAPGDPVVTLSLKEDKTYSLNASAQQGAIKLSVDQKGTYVVQDKDKQISFTATSISLNGAAMPVPKAQATKTVPYALKDGKLSITQDGTELVLTRVTK
jgi:hypothetical protein